MQPDLDFLYQLGQDWEGEDWKGNLAALAVTVQEQKTMPNTLLNCTF